MSLAAQNKNEKRCAENPSKQRAEREVGMCRIFAGQDPANYEYRTRSVRLGGHATSIRLESTFWKILDDIATGQGLTTPRFLSTLYDEVLETHGSIGNFASLLRVSCVNYLHDPGRAIAEARRDLEQAVGE